MNTQTDKPLPAFTVDAPATIEWPVTVTHPVDGGEMATFRLTGVFKRLAENELDELVGVPDLPPFTASEGLPSAPPVPIKPMSETLKENFEIFRQVLVGWDAKNNDGSDAAFTEARLQAVTTGPNGPFFSAGIWQAIAEIRHGARLGN